MKPVITVLMAVYDGEAYLKECVDSVLNQTFKDFEFLIIDDGSVDSTSDIIKTYKDERIRLLRNEKNLSQVASLNIGLDHAIGGYIARIDADDIMLPSRLERQLNYLKKRPDIALLGTFGEAIDEKGHTISRHRLPVRNEEIIATALFGEFIMMHSSIMFRKDIVFEAGKYNEAFSFTEDYKLATDLLARRYKINNIPDILIKYRLHNNRISVRDSKPQIERYIIALKEFMKNFSSDIAEKDSALLFDFLLKAGSMDITYWDKATEKDVEKAIRLSGLLLGNVARYFKLNKMQNYFMKRIFYNRILNFAYLALRIKNTSVAKIYSQCLKNSFFILDKPKLYIYPAKAVFSRLNKR